MENNNVLESNYPYLNNMDYTTQQMILPLDLGKKLNSSDPVFSFLKVMEGVNWNKYLHACKTDIRFMYLMNEEQPSHMAIQRFINHYMKDSVENIFKDIFTSICSLDIVDTDVMYIDGTKIEANANKFTFIWKKTAIKTRDKTFMRLNFMISKLSEYIECASMYEWTPEEIQSLIDKLTKVIEKQGIQFVYGKGKHKTPLQRLYDDLIKYKGILENCMERINLCGPDRNSCSKTDHDATMMHMKEDYYMKTGIFKAGYNAQISVSDEYISYACVFQDRADQKTLMKFLERYRALYASYPKTVVADAGYGSYDNYFYCLEHNIEAYIKYTMYSKEKETKYQKRKYLKANWEQNEYGQRICPAGHVFTYEEEHEDKRSKYPRINQKHSCGKCSECERKDECTKSKGDRSITVNPILEEFEKTAKENLDSEQGIQYRVQRSIQTEGAFGVIKENNQYDRFHRRNIKNVEMEFQLVCIGFNLMKYHNKKNRQKLQS
ncbi:transposase [Amedibacillus sp. YH-ame6]